MAECGEGRDLRSALTPAVHHLQLLTDPLMHVALLALSVCVQWTFPFQWKWSVIPLSISLLVLLLHPVSRLAKRMSMMPPIATSTWSYPSTMLCVIGPVQWFCVFVLFVIAPAALGASDIVPYYFGVYVATCAAIAMLSWAYSRKTVRATGKGGVQPEAEGTPQVTAAWFNLVILCLFYGLFTIWPYIAARRMSCPEVISAVVASLERAANNPNNFARLGSLPFGGYGNSYSVTTRGQMVALVGNAAKPRSLLLSSEHLHVLLLVLLLCGSLGRSWLLLRRNRLRNTIDDLLAVGVTATLYLVSTWWDVLSGHISPTLWPYRGWGLLCVTLLWLALRSLLLTVHRHEDQQQKAGIVTLQFPRVPSAPTVLCGLLVVGGVLLLWHEPGTLKPGRILIDEMHSDWEKADLPMETEFYGVKTVYNYGFLKEILENHYSSVQVNQQPISKELLSQCDVLVLKTPTKPYQPEEVHAIRNFVQNGGGLWLIGDHTNIFGMNTYLNQVSGTWGIYFNADAITPLPDFYQETVQVEGLAPYYKCGNRSHENLYSRKWLNHPIIGHNIPYLTVLTSCSVSAPLNCEYVSISRGTFADHAKFGGNTFFGNLEHDDDERYGCILQNVAVKSGRGRVAVWSDSTVFSNFAMCMSGVPQLALGYVNWLNRSNLISSANYKAIWVVILALIACAVARARNRPADLILSSLMGVILVGCAVPTVDYLNSCTYAIGDYRKGFRTVGFEEQYSSIELPNKDHVHQGDRKVYETFYVLMQRMHLMPVSADRLGELATCDAIVIVNPVKDVKEEDIARLRELLYKGGSVILMLGRESQHRGPAVAAAERLNRLLEQLEVGDRFNIFEATILTDLYGQLMEPSALTDVEIDASIGLKDDRAIVLLKCAEGAPVAITRVCGKGRLFLCSVADIYSNAGMGEPGTVPKLRQAIVLRSSLRFMSEAVEEEQDQKRLRAP